MENISWIKLFRKFREWEWYDNNNVKVLFLELLLTVNYEDKMWHGIPIKRGQILTGIEDLGKRTNLNYQQTRTAIDKLISTNEITKVSTPLYTIISVNNYDSYQGLTKVATNEQPTSNQPLTTTKELKNIKNISNKKKILKKEKTYTKENLTIQEVATKLVEHFEAENNRKSKLAPNSYKNLAYWLEVYEPNEIAEAISQIKYDSFWKDKMDLTILFRQSSKGEPVNWIDTLLNKKKENYARR